jgi:hypothetical protein
LPKIQNPVSTTRYWRLVSPPVASSILPMLPSVASTL